MTRPMSGSAIGRSRARRRRRWRRRRARRSRRRARGCRRRSAPGCARRLPAAQTHLGGDLVADEADHTGRREHPEMRQVLRVDEAQDRLVEGDAGRDEDREDNEQSGELLAAEVSAGRRRSRAAPPSAHHRSCGSGRRAERPSPRARRSTVCATAVTPSTARLIETALTPSRERTIERSTSRASARARRERASACGRVVDVNV